MSNSSIRESLQKIETHFSNHPELAKLKNPAAVATIQGGLLCQARGPHGESATTDMPVAMGGTASAPNPGWLLRAALASCLATTLSARSARLGIPLSLVEVTVESDSDVLGVLGLSPEITAGFTHVTTRVRISSDSAPRSDLEELVKWSAQHSPVGRTVCDATSSALAVEIVSNVARQPSA